MVMFFWLEPIVNSSKRSASAFILLLFGGFVYCMLDMNCAKDDCVSYRIDIYLRNIRDVHMIL